MLLPAASIYKSHQFTLLLLWSSTQSGHTNFKVPALLFPSKNLPLPPLFLHHIQILHLLSFSLFFLQVCLPPELCQTQENTHRSKFTPANRERVSPHTLTHTDSQSPFILLFCHFTLSSANLARPALDFSAEVWEGHIQLRWSLLSLSEVQQKAESPKWGLSWSAEQDV